MDEMIRSSLNYIIQFSVLPQRLSECLVFFASLLWNLYLEEPYSTRDQEWQLWKSTLQLNQVNLAFLPPAAFGASQTWAHHSLPFDVTFTSAWSKPIHQHCSRPHPVDPRTESLQCFLNQKKYSGWHQCVGNHCFYCWCFLRVPWRNIHLPIPELLGNQGLIHAGWAPWDETKKKHINLRICKRYINIA